MPELTGKQKRALRGLAHDLGPVVQIGNAGLSDAVIRQIDEALERHELIKVKIAQDAPVGKREANDEIRRRTRSSDVQQIGRVLVFYRERKKDPTIELPPGGGRGGGRRSNKS
jgi:RNA-binding protein